jgi:putative membrane protein
VKHILGKGLSAFILSSGLVLIPVSAQTGSSSSNPSSQSTTASSPGNKAESNQSSKLSAADRQFVTKAAEGGKAEVELGQLAADKATSPDVKKFGQRMVDDHTKANQELQQVASQKGINVPDKLSSKDEATKARLEKLSGKQFDQAYMHSMVADHTKDVSEFQQASTTAKDPDVKSFAKNTLPTLKDHLKMAKQIAPKSTTTSSNANPSKY